MNFITSVEFYTLSALVNAISSIGIGFLIYFQNKRAHLNRSFFYFAISVAVWSTFYIFWQLAYSSETALRYVRLLMAGAIFTAPAYLHFVLNLLETESKKRLLVSVMYIVALIFLIMDLLPTLAPFFVNRVEPFMFFQFWPKPGSLFHLYLAWWMGCLIYAGHLLILRLKEVTDPIIRKQIVFVLMAMLIAFISGSTNYLPWYGIAIPPFANILVSLYILIIGYAVLKHHLFNTKVLSTELLTFSLWGVLLFRTFLSDNTADQIANLILLVFVMIIGILLIRGVIREVEQRELIQKQEQELEVVNKQQEGLLHFISHEVKGYLAKNEAGFAAITEGDYGSVSKPLKDMAASALIDTRKGVDTVMNILDASNLKKGTVTYEKKSFNYSVAIEDVVNSLKQMAQERGITLEYTDSTGVSSIINGDENKLRRHVIRNLIDNSLRYTLSGGVRVELSRTAGAFRMTITDTGVGITSEDMGKLFTEGGHGTDSIKVNVHSTGYGLYIAKSIVAAHGGKIWAESEGKGKGSKFIVELPTV